MHGVSSLGSMEDHAQADAELRVSGDDLTSNCGTVRFMAPEVFRGEEYGPEVDLWALGCVVYEMLHLMPAFKAEERFELEGLIRNLNFGRAESAEARKREKREFEEERKKLEARKAEKEKNAKKKKKSDFKF